MKTTAPAALRAAPSGPGRPTRPRSPVAPEAPGRANSLPKEATTKADPVRAGLAAGIREAIEEHRRRLGLAARAYAVRRAWTIGFLARIMADPLALRVGHVVAALDGTGYALMLARLPADPIPYAGSVSCAQPRSDDPEPQLLAPVIRLPANECLCDADGEDACPACA